MYEVVCFGGQVYRFSTPQELKAFVLKFFGKKVLVGQSFIDNFGNKVETKMVKAQTTSFKSYKLEVCV